MKTASRGQLIQAQPDRVATGVRHVGQRCVHEGQDVDVDVHGERRGGLFAQASRPLGRRHRIGVDLVGVDVATARSSSSRSLGSSSGSVCP